MSTEQLQPHLAGAGFGYSIMTPTNWVAIDSETLDQWKSDHGSPKSGTMDAAYIDLVDSALQALASPGTVFASILAVPGENRLLATITAVALGLPSSEFGTSLLSVLEANPPADAVEGSFDAIEVEHPSGDAVRTKSLRRNVLGLPSKAQVSLCIEYAIRPLSTDSVVVTTFSTPSVLEASRYTELFDLVASTITFTPVASSANSAS